MKISSHEHDLSGASWHKSSYSDGSGGNCLEAARDFPGAATWRKSSYSGGSGGNCLEIGAWHKSSHSDGSGGDCLEVARGLTGIVPVRDSKIPTGPVLTFPAKTWAVFISQVKAEQTA
ncbi:DUF397 domain-containing protein [Streptomyces odonnellii]|uniref:DUF397 domain-containing protein n=1 Tax=Streptomyces odonnellii TaxID=1417980 RepID=UPI0006253E2E|nr:DUF397 domain-containing protein [Streptomyces odonnellii]